MNSQNSIPGSDSRIQVSLQAGARWILDLQAEEGGFPFSFQDRGSLGAWPTSQAVVALLSFDPSLIPELKKSLKWLESIHQDFIWGPMMGGATLLDSTIWVVLAFKIAHEISGGYEEVLVRILDRIIECANQDGGWGSWKGDKTRAIITSQVIAVLRQLGSFDRRQGMQNSIDSAIGFLQGSQNPDGGWGFQPHEKSNEVATSYALIAMSGLNTCRDSIARATEWLEVERTPMQRSTTQLFKREAVWRKDGIQRWSYFALPIRLCALAMNVRSTQWYGDLRSMLDIQDSAGAWVDPDESFLAFHTYTSVYFLSRIRNSISLTQFDRYCHLIDEMRQEEQASLLAANRIRLKRIIMEDGLKISDTEFILISGKTSKYYYDLKRVLMNPVSVSLLGRMIWERVKYDFPNAIGGPETGAIPIAISVVRESIEFGQPTKAFFVRKSAKEYGTKKWLEGDILRGDRVILVEDVVTTGGSVIRAIERLREYGCEIIRVICIVDREEGGGNKIASMGIKFDPLFKHHEFEEVM